MEFRILIADDHALFRRTLCRFVAGRVPSGVIVEAADGEEAVRSALAHGPVLALMDVQMPHRTGIDAAREIRRLCLDCRIVLYSGHDLPASLVTGAREADAFVLKENVFAELPRQIELCRVNT